MSQSNVDAFTKIVEPLYTRECETEEIEAIYEALKTFLAKILEHDPFTLALAYMIVTRIIEDACVYGQISPYNDHFARLLGFMVVADGLHRTMPKPKIRECPGAPKKTKRARKMVELEVVEIE